MLVTMAEVVKRAVEDSNLDRTVDSQRTGTAAAKQHTGNGGEAGEVCQHRHVEPPRQPGSAPCCGGLLSPSRRGFLFPSPARPEHAVEA